MALARMLAERVGGDKIVAVPTTDGDRVQAYWYLNVHGPRVVVDSLGLWAEVSPARAMELAAEIAQVVAEIDRWTADAAQSERRHQV